MLTEISTKHKFLTSWFEFLSAVNIKIMVFWDVMPHSFVLHRYLQNIGIYMPTYVAQLPRRT